MKKKLFLINQIKKYFKKQYLIIKKQYLIISKKKLNEKKESNIGSISRTLLASLLIISFFSISPVVVEYAKNTPLTSVDFENKSKNSLKKLLDTENTESDKDINRKFLFEDILVFDEKPIDSVRLSAATIEELFKSTDYKLEDVRKTKLVKPISLTLLPTEIKKIENTKKRKDLFIQIILPLIIKENNYIRLDRKKLFGILNKSINTKSEKIWLNSKFKQYGVVGKDLSTLKVRMDEVPVSMAIAQAAKETGWGTSRFAQEGNALFGQWTWSGEGIKPSEADDDTTHKVMKFNVLQASVRAYNRNLNTHSSYKNFRKTRAKLRDKRKKLDSIILSEHLDKYAEIGKEYVKVLQQIIKQNNLTDFDDARLLPSSIRLESLI